MRTTTWKPETAMTPKQEERAAAVFADDFERKIKDTVTGSTASAENPNITFREFAAKWLEKTKRDCSLSYYVNSSDIIKEVNEYIGGYRLRDITPAVIQNLYDKLDKLQKTTSRIVPKPDFR